jgi:uncharacterized membrane protein
MNNANWIYREMLLADARKSKCPKLMSSLVKAFWWVSIHAVWTAIVALAVCVGVAIVLGVAATILHVAWLTWM